MQFNQDTPDGVYRIIGYSDRNIQINEGRYERSLLLMPDVLQSDWGPASLAELASEHLAPIRALEPEIVLLGTGVVQQFPQRPLMLELIQAGIGLEVMDTSSACRTYNLLMAEGRRVLAALIIDQE
ncbi:MAG: Mth938-like domain-containing protein [Spiribacter sp.]|jgi:uncharacterized protein|nr:Mth938-like domain-containing protein [Spiribacter sp.]MDR9489279.1 Mth938-like domain-containing protein [Spiribacter sp.]